MGFSKTLKSLLLTAAILAPAITLAVMGLRAYRAESLLLRERNIEDRRAIVRLVAGRLSEAARKALEDLEGRVGAHEADATLEARFRTAHPMARHIFVLQGTRLVYPAVVSPAGLERTSSTRTPGYGYLASELDVTNYVRRLRESRRQANRLTLGLRAEYAGRLKRARVLYQRASHGSTDPAAHALLALARVQRRQGLPEQARQSYALLRRRFGGRQDRDGVSYALLADVGLARTGEADMLGVIHRRLVRAEYLSPQPVRHFYLRWVVSQMARQHALAPSLMEQMRRETVNLFAAQRFGAQLQRHGLKELELSADEQIRGAVLDRRTSLVLRRRAGTVVGFSVDQGYLAERVAQHQREVAPPNRSMQLTLHRVGEVPRKGDGRLLLAMVLDPPLRHWTLAARGPLTDASDPLHQQGRVRRLGLVVGLILALLMGLLLTYRGVRRESELARLKSDFASNVSHELKTPLTSIRMYAEMLEQGIASTPTDRTRYQRVIIRESERLGRLIANVLDFSRLEKGTRRYELEPVELGVLTREAVDTFRRLAEGEQLDIRLSGLDGDLPRVIADREAAVQSLLNLLSNAAKYSPEDPEIEVRILVRQREAGVEVRDRGIGIPAGEQKRIFEDFYRAPNSRRAGVEGTGLGLALVRRHMKACGGRVDVQSEPGRGSRFTLWFPVDTSSEEVADG